MRTTRMLACVVAVTVLAGTGCKKNSVDQSAFKSALNNYLGSQQECLWNTPIKFPVQADTSNDNQTRGFDALTDAGLLMRKSAEKKRFLVGSKQVNDYDLSSQGRSTWTADASQPGYGNFCYGHPEVTSIDGYSPQASDATQYTVNYHYSTSSLPNWANSTEMKTAFPDLAAISSGSQSGSATLVKSNNGWLVQNAQPTKAQTGATPPNQ